MKIETLPLTALEELFVWANRPACPCLIFSGMRFSGILDHGRLKLAAGAALERHPLLRSRVEMVPGGKLRWVIAGETDCEIDWQTGPLQDGFAPVAPIDLARECGVRLRVRIDDQRSELVVIFHHACVDGAGGQQFIEDLMIAYALACGETSPRVRLAPLDPELLAGRGRFDLSPGKFLRSIPDLAVGLLGVRQYLMRRPVPLAPCEGSDSHQAPPEYCPGVLDLDFDLEETAALRQATRQLGDGITLNDLLTRDLFLAIVAWREQEKVAREEGWLRVMIPTDLRTRAARKLPGANVVGAVFLDRQAEQLSDPGRLLAGIHDELELIKSHRFGLIFIGSVLAARLLPGGLRRIVPQHRRLGTAIFSNIGRIYAGTPLPRNDHRLLVGNVVLERIQNVVPLFSETAASFTASVYARRLSLTLHYDTRVLSGVQAGALLDAWAGRLRASCFPAPSLERRG